MALSAAERGPMVWYRVHDLAMVNGRLEALRFASIFTPKRDGVPGFRSETIGDQKESTGRIRLSQPRG
jgi:hypothetical protein